METHNLLKIWADYHSWGVFDYTDGMPLWTYDVPLSAELWVKLKLWCEDYEVIIVNEEERKKRADEISMLDKRGLDLRDAIAASLGTDFQVHYYSEGLLRYIGEERILNPATQSPIEHELFQEKYKSYDALEMRPVPDSWGIVDKKSGKTLNPRLLRLPFELWLELGTWTEQYDDSRYRLPDWTALQKWTKKHDSLSDWDCPDKAEYESKIGVLEKQGLSIAKQVRQYLGTKTQVDYYSDAMQRYLEIE